MTSRVQKGGPVFRPVLKSRTRLDSRQASIHVDPPDSETNGSTPSALMPPPPIGATLVESMSQHMPTTDAEIPLEPSTLLPPQSRPPTLIQSSRPTALNLQTQNASCPPLAISHAVPIFAIAESSRPDLFPPPLSVLHHSGTENIHRPMNGFKTVIGSRNSPERTRDTVLANDHPETLDEATQAVAGTSSVTAADASNPKPSKKRKKKKAGSETEDSHSEPSKLRNNRKRRTSSGITRKSRGPSLPPFDPHADPGEDLDPTVVTMASLCNDTGQGRISSKAAEILSNHTAWKAQNRAKRVRMKTLMEFKKYGKDEEAEGTEEHQNISIPKGPQCPNTMATTSGGPAIVDDTGSGFDYSQDLQTSRFNVQVRIGPNGETIIDEESLVVDRTEAEDTTSYTHVVESDHTKFVNSGTYAKRYRGSRWSAEETELFYDALSQYGENYELIAYVLPGRDRKSCKNKFKAEDKKNPARINYCLRNSTPVDMATLSRMTGKDFSGPTPEIRIPTLQPRPESDSTIQVPDHVPNLVPDKRRKKTALNEDVVIVGEADSFLPSSP